MINIHYFCNGELFLLKKNNFKNEIAIIILLINKNDIFLHRILIPNR